MTKLHRNLFSSLGISALLALSSPVSADELVVVIKGAEVGVSTYDMLTAINSNVASTLIYEPLIEQNADHGYVPALAESWEEAPDGMQWTFRLRQGIKFHNGVDFNAQAVADWLGMFAGTDFEYYLGAVEEIVVVDDYTIRLDMNRPDPNLLYNLSTPFGGVMEPGARQSDTETYGLTEAVGTGPYLLESFAVGQETVLVRNEDYTWGAATATNTGPANIERIRFREIGEASTAFLELQTGGVDMLLGVPQEFLSEVASLPSIQLMTMPDLEIYYMVMNVTAAPFDDIRVRQAAALAVNQQAIRDNLFGGVGNIPSTFMIASLPEEQVADEFRISFDLDRAGALLDEAGWVAGADGIREKDGQPLSVTLWTQSDSNFRRVTEVIQAQLRDAGFAAEILTFDSATIRDQYKAGTHQAAVRSYFYDNAVILDWFFGGDRPGYPNISMFNDPTAEALRATAMTGSRNGEEFTQNFIAYHEYILSQFPFAPIYEPVGNIAYSADRVILPETINSPVFQRAAFMDLMLAN
jgi:peptide/nickel transport system substrate-binding protein